MPLALLSARLVKNPTVNGTIGNIQGRKKAATPAKSPSPNVIHRETGFALSKTGWLVVLAVESEEDLASTTLVVKLSSVDSTGVKSKSSGIVFSTVSVWGAKAKFCGEFINKKVPIKNKRMVIFFIFIF